MARGEKGRERVRRADPVEPQFHPTGEAVATDSHGVRSEIDQSLRAKNPTARTGKTGRWRLSNWRLRTKLLAVLLIPSVAATIFGGLRVADGVSQVGSLTGIGEEMDLQTPAGKVIQELQRERDLSVAYVASRKTIDPGLMRQQRQRVDATIQEFRAAADASTEGVGRPYRMAARDLEVLSTVRDAVDRTAYPAEDVTRSYTDRVVSMMDLTQQGISHIRDPGLLRLALATNALLSAQEAASQKRAELNTVLHSGSFGPDQTRRLLTVEAKLEAAVNDFRTWATPQQSQYYDDTVTGLQVDNARHIEEYALSLNSADKPVVLNPESWDASSTEMVNLIAHVHGSLQQDLARQHDQVTTRTNQQIIIATVATLGALVLAFAIALMVARSLLVPLRTLRRSALDVADKRLPEAVESILHESNPEVAARARVEPIPVHTTEEIGRVARSFDAVHSQALRLASEQALLRNNVNDLFVNLARRSQTLVQRQLSLIDSLEQDEQDPDQLSSLFELDHLATRMRRNNENLLILGGTDLTRRMMRPVPLSEVVGAAVSEVEQYARIVVSDAPELAIQGRVVNDLVHLVAELLENATVFSNPDTEVNVRTAYRRQELVVEIRDRGVGIDAAELEEINGRLLRPPEVDVAVSRRMGLYVVGQLARRYNIGVQLHNNDDLEGGITATVRLSGEYVAQLTPDGPMPMPDVPPSAIEEQRDSLTESGTHLGLAAAFGRGGVADWGQPEPPAERALPAGDRNAAGPTEFHPMSGEDEPSVESDEDFSAPYSVQVASGQRFGASDVPHWYEADSDDVGEALWPEEDTPVPDEVPEAHHGQCGVPPTSVEESGSLFLSPFEDQKTAKFDKPAEWTWESAVAGTSSSGTDQWAATENAQAKGAGREMDDAPTERLPIYEAVLSQWFRESDDPVADDSTRSTRRGLSDPGLSVEPPALGEPASNGLGAVSEETVSASDAADELETKAEPEAPAAQSNGAMPAKTETGLPKRMPRPKRAKQEPAAEPPTEESVTQFARVSQNGVSAPQQADDPGWGAADAGWEAAEALMERSKQAHETTSAGLPKRVPKSNLVPGSAAPKPQSSAPPRKPAAPRSADAVRGRMSNFQQGVRRGRHHKAEPVSTEQPRSIPSRPEEQE